jgi:hypothetical protein
MVAAKNNPRTPMPIKHANSMESQILVVVSCSMVPRKASNDDRSVVTLDPNLSAIIAGINEKIVNPSISPEIAW